MNRKRFFELLAVAGTAGVFANVTPALGADEENEPELTEIVVTAQKRTEDVQRVPIAVTAFTAETRDLIGIETTQDLSTYAPGVSYNFQADRMYLRGLGRTTNDLAVDSAVATYVDGFYSSFNRAADSSSIFLSQEEILRGPQGTLYGRNAIGGVYNVASARPTSDWTGEVRGRLGNYESGDVEGTISGPLIGDYLRFRATAGQYVQDEGDFQSSTGIHDNDGFGLNHSNEFQLQLAGNVGTAFDWWVKGDHTSWNKGWGTSPQITPYVTGTPASCVGALTGVLGLSCTGNLVPNPQYNAAPGLNPAAPQLGANPSASDPYSIGNDTPNRERLKDNMLFVFNGTGHLGFADLKLISGYFSNNYSLVTDYDNTDRTSYLYTPTTGAPPVTINSAEHFTYNEIRHYYSNELNLISTTDSPLQYVLGLYQFTDHAQQPITYGSNVPQPQVQAPINPLTGAPAAPNLSGDYLNLNQNTISESAAVFGQLDWKFADTLKATVGARYTKDRKASEESAREILYDPTLGGALEPAIDISPLEFAANGGVPNPNGNGSYVRFLSVDSHATTGTAGLTWTPTSDSLGYAKISRGYKEAGINAGQGIVASPYTKPEFLNAFELGWKQTLNRTFQTNTSVFYYKYDGAQTPLNVLTGQIYANSLFNLNEKIYGAEIENLWQATNSLRFLLDYSYLHATFVDNSNVFQDPLTFKNQSLNDNSVPESPRNKATFNTVYTWNFTPGSFAMSGSYAWRDRITSSSFNDVQFQAGSFGQADFRGTWTPISNRWSIYGYLRNAFDVRGSDSGVSQGSVQFSIPTSLFRSYVPPRTFGAQFSYRFGALSH
jgi:iron complex outermembrane recepter protein